jgi:hypothetical protein
MLFQRLTGISKNDAKVRRAISSWGEVERGGQAPCLDFMNDEAKKSGVNSSVVPKYCQLLCSLSFHVR